MQVSAAVEPPGRQMPTEGMRVLTDEEAHEVALGFARDAEVDWDLRGYHLALSPDLSVAGMLRALGQTRKAGNDVSVATGPSSSMLGQGVQAGEWGS